MLLRSILVFKHMYLIIFVQGDYIHVGADSEREKTSLEERIKIPRLSRKSSLRIYQMDAYLHF